jgi:hypothetical protein
MTTMVDNETTGMTELDYSSVEAPYGRDENGKPLAPYGVKTDGVTPQKKRGRPSSGSAQRSVPRVSAVKPRRGAKSYADGITGLLGIPAALCGALGNSLCASDDPGTQRNGMAFKADEATFALAAPGIAPVVTVALAVVFAGLQVAANHGAIKPLPSLGIQTPEQQIAIFAQMNAQQAA